MTPPFAFTQVKYALIMFGPSLKSVPGCLVSIVPMLIGVPVALTPGFGPHDDVLVEPVLALAVVPLVLALVALEAPLLDVVELLLLLPHPASTSMRADEHGQRAGPAQAQRLVVRPHPLLLLEVIWLIRPGLARRRSYSGADLYATSAYA